MFDRKGNRKYLNGPERAAFLRAAKNELDGLRQAFCLTLYHTGCRISEGLNLTVERIDVAEKALVLETLKRRKRGLFRSVPVPDALIDSLCSMAVGLQPSVRVFDFSRPTGYRLIKERMAVAEITGGMASPKGLRHGFAIACIAKNIPLTTVQKWMGHARLETTAIYLNVAGEEERDLAKRLWTEADEG